MAAVGAMDAAAEKSLMGQVGLRTSARSIGHPKQQNGRHFIDIEDRFLLPSDVVGGAAHKPTAERK